MKRFKFLSVVALVLIGAAVLSQKAHAASPYVVTVGTVAPNGSTNGAAAFTAASYPTFTGAARIRQVTIDNLTSGSAERVQIWSLCTSSTTAVLKWAGVVPASSTLTVPFLPNMFPVTSPCVQKGTVDSNSVIKATLFTE